MKLWIDDIRPAPEGYIWARSTDDAIIIIKTFSTFIDMVAYKIEEPQTLPWFDVIDIDYDAEDYADCGGDFINVLNYMEGREQFIAMALSISEEEVEEKELDFEDVAKADLEGFDEYKDPCEDCAFSSMSN